MALDLTGIANRGEFYAHHYLDALLEKDIKPLLKQWANTEQAGGRRSPPKALNSLATAWFHRRAEVAELGHGAHEASWRLAAAHHASILETLGYERNAAVVPLDDGTHLPLVHEERVDGRAHLWVLETGFSEPDANPLDQVPLAAQLPPDAVPPTHTWRALLDRTIFRQEDAPTWVIALCGDEVVLTHRYKWSRGKALAFELDALYARRQPAAFRVLAALLHRDAICPKDGTSLHDTLDDSSHKHAVAVSTDLRLGAQEAIELLGNEVVYHLKNVQKRGVFGTGDADALDADALTGECMIWLYRLIFLLYTESRSEDIAIAPMRADAYRLGYSLESLRDLATITLTTPQAQSGTYLDESLRQLFRLVDEGYPLGMQLALQLSGQDQDGLNGVDGHDFRLPGLHSRLFDDSSTPILRTVRLRNRVLQRIIELLSLTRHGSGKKGEGRQRISYATLGINQLGSVYEGLLSYTGFFATEDLLEVCAASDQGHADARTWFVPVRLREHYTDDEIVRLTEHDEELSRGEAGMRRLFARGTYLYRLSGRDREKSASYYTPEVLTSCLVKYTLRERIGTEPTDPNWLAADALLDLSICEPAMGSGAFLNEVVNQLAEAYLQRKQAETDTIIASEAYPAQLQRVKARIAATNCYGVDLNPLAAELGKVSLWLNVLQAGAPSPFFDPRLVTGNSLVGARHAVYALDVLHKRSKKAGANWLDLAPTDVALGEARPEGTVWHFLLPADGMARFDGDKVVKGLAPEKVAAIKAWRKKLNTAWSPAHRQRLLTLSTAVDHLWQTHTNKRKSALHAVTQEWPVWPQPARVVGDRTEERELAERWAAEVRTNVEGRRLEAVLNTWCALWFWPVQQAELLPDRDAWLGHLEELVHGTARTDLDVAEDAYAQRWRVVQDVRRRHPFVHWTWQFPEVFAQGGFDVVVGNPPWIKVQWNEQGVLSDLDPRMALRRMSAKQTADRRTETLEGSEEALGDYLEEFEGMLLRCTPNGTPDSRSLHLRWHRAA